ncbi:MAG TPA: metallophosphoesterase [Myxococcota bacterium]|nr:metallophosphoesterase [Myxococcota bacterium]
MLLFFSCTSAPTDTGPGDSFRVVFIADSHVIGPQYTEPSENGDLDNESIMKTPERLQGTVDRINAMDPQPEAVFVLGDVVHDSYHSDDLDWFADNETGFSRSAELLGQLRAPSWPLWGNHDYELDCEGSGWSRAFSADLFSQTFQVDPYFSVDMGGWRFISANSMLGPTWEAGHELCDTSKASYGREQLAWMDELLDEGLPTVWMAHYMLPVITQRDEDPEGEHPDVFSVLEGHDNTALSLVGHTHRWLDFSESYHFPHYVVAATRYDDDNFWVVEFGEDGAWRVVDMDKSVWFTTCADTWNYTGEPTEDPDGVETGDCGY